MSYISELPNDKIQPDTVYEKIQGRISCWDKCDTDMFHKRFMKAFKEQERVTILTKNKLVLNPMFDLKPWMDNDEACDYARRISVIVLPKSESIDIQE